MLIGNNVHKASEPWEVIHSQDDGPYAIRTCLGWTVNGPIIDNYQKAHVNFVNLKTIDQMLTRQFNYDFSERISEDKPERSREDNVFMSRLEKPVKMVEGHYETDLPLKHENVDSQMSPNDPEVEKKTTVAATSASHSVDTDSCINALLRFISRRGQVVEIWSDNGTNLVATDRELRRSIQQWNQQAIQWEMLQLAIDWKFNPPTGSHFGGVWERQIRTVRQILNGILRSQTLTDESLHTMLCEVEATINSRPITTVSMDINDVEPLTPNHLLLLKGKPCYPPGIFVQTDLYARRRWRQVQYLADLFWKRWTGEYLPQLQQRQKWSRPRRNFKIGDVVLIVDDKAPRNSWLLGRIISVMPDKNGEVRRVKVKTAAREFERPISKLCLLLEADP